MNALPEDVFYIYYAELAPNAEQRLYLLSLIGLLLNKLPGTYTAEELGLKPNDWNVLCEGLGRGNGSFFWQLETSYIRVQRKCEKHILIDTVQLISDISSTSQKRHRSIYPSDQ